MPQIYKSAVIEVWEETHPEYPASPAPADLARWFAEVSRAFPEPQVQRGRKVQVCIEHHPGGDGMGPAVVQLVERTWETYEEMVARLEASSDPVDMAELALMRHEYAPEYAHIQPGQAFTAAPTMRRHCAKPFLSASPWIILDRIEGPRGEAWRVREKQPLTPIIVLDPATLVGCIHRFVGDDYRPVE